MAHDVNQCKTEVAAQVQSALVSKIGSERYDLWIADNTQWCWQDGVLTLKFDSEFSCQLAKKMLTAELAETLTSMESADAQVAFEVCSHLAGQRQSQAAALPRRATRPIEDSVLPSETPVNVPSHQAGESLETDLWNQYIPGQANQLAWTAAGLVVSEPGRLSPVLLHGPAGSGKSLLVAAVAQRLRTARRLRRVVHMTSEQFTNDFTEGLRGDGMRNGGLPLFRRKYRDVDALILEDLQFLVGKKSTLTEVKHTIDNLLRTGKQVLLTADRPLAELSSLGGELTGRLRGGLNAPLYPLDQEIRQRLLSRHLQQAGLDVDQQLVIELAERTCGDGRVLSGIANRLTAVAAYHSGPLTWDVCWQAVFDLVQATRPVVGLHDIEQAVCSMCGLAADSLQSPSKTRSVSQPRMLAMFLARKYTPAAYKEIGNYFGKRRHSTVISAEKTVETWLEAGTNLELRRGLSIRDAIRHVESQLQVG